MASSRKKAIVRKWNQDWIPGYLPADGFQHQPDLELLDLAGKIQVFSFSEVKWICFVRDFNSGDISNPERLLRKTFAGRPRTTGLWLRLHLRDDDTVEGLAATDSTLISSRGIFLAPPDTRSNTQRIFLPAESVSALEALGLIGGGARHGAQKPTPAPPADKEQANLFSKA